MSEDQLKQAIELINLGKTENARELLEKIIKDDRNNISAWQWYAETWHKKSEKIRIWQTCLRFNPSNSQAKQALEALDPNRVRKESVKPASTITPPDDTETPSKGTGSSRWLLWGSLGLFVVLLIFAGIAIRNAVPLDAAEYRHTQPVEYYLYVPKDYSPDQDWPLFIGIHGSGSSGLECWNLWQSYADKEGFILLCPTIPGDAFGYKQDVGERTVWSAIGEVQKEYSVQQKMFMSGFSAGAFFIQGFNLHYPQYVSGLSILSSGLYLNPREFPAFIPIAVVIGEADDPGAVSTSQFFVNDLEQIGFDVQYERLAGVGHTVTNKGKDLTIDLFRKAISK